MGIHDACFSISIEMIPVPLFSFSAKHFGKSIAMKDRNNSLHNSVSQQGQQFILF
jgi:hypothetical protein